MKRYRKTYEPEAIQINESTTEDEIFELLCSGEQTNQWIPYQGKGYWFFIAANAGRFRHLRHSAIEESTEIHYGDWLVKGINGDIYPVSDEVFRKTYEEVS